MTQRYMGIGREDGTGDTVRVYGDTPEAVENKAMGLHYRVRLRAIYDMRPDKGDLVEDVKS